MKLGLVSSKKKLKLGLDLFSRGLLILLLFFIL